MRLKQIFRYPIKGLSPESLDTIVLKEGAGMPFDRYFAIAHGNSKFDFNHPQWIQRRNFVVVAHSPRLAAAESHYDSEKSLLTIKHSGQITLRVDLADESADELINKFFSEFIGDYQPGPYRIAKVPGMSLTDSPDQAVSLMNLGSLRQLGSILGKSLDLQRFRGNLWFESNSPWIEFDWIGKEIRLGDIRLEVIERLERCAAINASPETGERDIDGLRVLKNHFGHRDFGILARVKKGGSITVGDAIETA